MYIHVYVYVYAHVHVYVYVYVSVQLDVLSFVRICMFDFNVYVYMLVVYRCT